MTGERRVVSVGFWSYEWEWTRWTDASCGVETETLELAKAIIRYLRRPSNPYTLHASLIERLWEDDSCVFTFGVSGSGAAESLLELETALKTKASAL